VISASLDPRIFAAAVVVGALAAVLRWLVSRAFAKHRFPWAVLVVNIVGSAFGGAVAAVASADLRLIVLGGLCGGLTTFSTFSVETIQLVQERRTGTAVLSAGGNLVLGFGAAALAYGLATSIA
jgi:CrcB protein